MNPIAIRFFLLVEGCVMGKICPLMAIANPDYSEKQCFREQCAWWCEKEKACGLYAGLDFLITDLHLIRRLLERISIELQRLASR